MLSTYVSKKVPEKISDLLHLVNRHTYGPVYVPGIDPYSFYSSLRHWFIFQNGKQMFFPYYQSKKKYPGIGYHKTNHFKEFCTYEKYWTSLVHFQGT